MFFKALSSLNMSSPTPDQTQRLSILPDIFMYLSLQDINTKSLKTIHRQEKILKIPGSCMSPSLPSPAPPLPSSQLTDPTSAVCTGPITPTGGEDTPEERDPCRVRGIISALLAGSPGSTLLDCHGAMSGSFFPLFGRGDCLIKVAHAQPAMCRLYGGARNGPYGRTALPKADANHIWPIVTILSGPKCPGIPIILDSQRLQQNCELLSSWMRQIVDNRPLIYYSATYETHPKDFVASAIYMSANSIRLIPWTSENYDGQDVEERERIFALATVLEEGEKKIEVFMKLPLSSDSVKKAIIIIINDLCEGSSKSKDWERHKKDYEIKCLHSSFSPTLRPAAPGFGRSTTLFSTYPINRSISVQKERPLAQPLTLKRRHHVLAYIFSFWGPVTYDALIFLEAPHAVNRALKAHSEATHVYHCLVPLPTIIPPPQRLPAASCHRSIQCSTYHADHILARKNSGIFHSAPQTTPPEVGPSFGQDSRSGHSEAWLITSLETPLQSQEFSKTLQDLDLGGPLLCEIKPSLKSCKTLGRFGTKHHPAIHTYGENCPVYCCGLSRSLTNM
ncbi:hypothetical protein DFH09DRAFT_1086601 [Mycena vulgaris]|nr:hypothetical protein DFH09DRAFT_1086601 [Mycena vulgaris]